VKNINNIISKVLKYFKRSFTKIYYDKISIRIIYAFLTILILLVSKYLYRFSLDITLWIAKIISDPFQDNKIIQFILIFLPIFLISYILSKFTDSYSFRTIRYYLISIFLFVEVFVIDVSTLNISSYIYFYITLETLIYFISNDIKSKGEKNVEILDN